MSSIFLQFSWFSALAYICFGNGLNYGDNHSDFQPTKLYHDFDISLNYPLMPHDEAKISRKSMKWRRPVVPSIVHQIRQQISPRHASTPNISYHDHPFEIYEKMKNGENATRDREKYNGRRREEELAEKPQPHKPIRIKYDMTLLEARRNGSPTMDQRIDVITKNVLPRVKDFWKDHIAVVPVQQPFPGNPSWESACQSVSTMGPSYEVEPNDSSNDEVYDLLIFVTAFDQFMGEAVCEQGAAAFAYPCQFDQYDRPIIGSINFCLDVLEAVINESGKVFIPENDVQSAYDISLHETTHVLGLSSNLFPFFRDSVTGEPLTPGPKRPEIVTCVDGKQRPAIRPSRRTLMEGRTKRGVRYFDLVTPRVTAVVRNHFNCQTLRGARLENQPTNGFDCYGSHFDERLFLTDSMSASLDAVVNVLSPLTLAFLEDTGWYVANYTGIKVSPFGHGAGCAFVEDDCIDNTRVPAEMRDFFCDQISPMDSEGRPDFFRSQAPRCDTSYTHMAFCDLVEADEDVQLAPRSSQYFGKQNVGPLLFPLADHCPIRLLSVLDCTDPSSSTLGIPGAKVGPSSLCFNGMGFTIGEHPMCLESKCNGDGTISVFVSGVTIVCEQDYEVHSLPGTSLTFECPRFASACPNVYCPANCAGRGVCDFDNPNGPRCICDDPNDKSAGCTKDSSTFAANDAFVDIQGLQDLIGQLNTSVQISDMKSNDPQDYNLPMKATATSSAPLSRGFAI